MRDFRDLADPGQPDGALACRQVTAGPEPGRLRSARRGATDGPGTGDLACRDQGRQRPGAEHEAVLDDRAAGGGGDGQDVAGSGWRAGFQLAELLGRLPGGGLGSRTWRHPDGGGELRAGRRAHGVAMVAAGRVRN